jgi:hypothetical protein
MGLASASVSKPGDDYEQAVHELVGRLAIRAAVETTRLDHNVVVAGRATPNQIDVLWDFNDAAGQQHRVVFEARVRGRPVEQKDLHAFRSVVEDIQDVERPVVGVMVTTTGYQAGAKRIAETYGLLVLELRLPTEVDLDGRVTAISFILNVAVPVIENLTIEAIEVLDGQALEERAPWDPLEVGLKDNEPLIRLEQVLVEGELGSLEIPSSLHLVRRVFDPPATLFLDRKRVATVGAVSATVGSSAAPPVTFTVGGIEGLALMLRDALSGARLWFAQDGHIWSTDS